MVRPGIEGATDPLLGRPLALYDVVLAPAGTPCAFDVVYLVVGRGTACLARRQPGERIAVWGPLGNGFGPAPTGDAVFVAGGIGQTPFLALGRSWLGRESRDQTRLAQFASNEIPAPGTHSKTQGGGIVRESEAGTGLGSRSKTVTLLYGVRTAALLAGVDDFRQAGIEVELATDDGTAGHHGFVTELLGRRLSRGERPAKVVGCGPTAMLSTLAKLVAAHHIDCEVSLENHMACGFGACFSCVAPIRKTTTLSTCEGFALRDLSCQPVESSGREWPTKSAAVSATSASRRRLPTFTVGVRLGLDLITEPCGLLVVFSRDGFVELLGEVFFNEEFLTDFLLNLAELFHKRGIRRLGRIVLLHQTRDASSDVQSRREGHQWLLPADAFRVPAQMLPRYGETARFRETARATRCNLRPRHGGGRNP